MDPTIQTQFTKYTRNNLPGYLNYPAVIKLIKKIMCYDEVLGMIEKYKEVDNYNLVDEIISHVGLNVNYVNTEKIPASGRLLVVANHPLGAADWLLLLQGMNPVRRDIKVVINQDVYQLIENLRDLFIPVNTYATFNDQAKVRITNSLNNEEAVIIFPAGGISIPTIRGIRDRKWKCGTIMFSRENKVNILPVYISGRSSMAFICCPKKYRRFLLVRNLLHPPRQKIRLVFGDLITSTSIEAFQVATEASHFLREQVYALGKNQTNPDVKQHPYNSI